MARAKVWMLLMALAVTGAACSRVHSEPVGAFTVRSTTAEFAAHSASQVSLWYGWRRLTPRLTSHSVDPQVPKRILFASRAAGTCGTFLFDGRTGRQHQISASVLSVSALSEGSPYDFEDITPWSPDGRFVYAGTSATQPLVVDLGTHRVTDLSDAVTLDGKRLEMRPLKWANDGPHLAVQLEPHGFNGRRDLIVIHVDTLSVDYVATMDAKAPVWTTRDYRWEGDRLVTVGEGFLGRIHRIPVDQLGWRPGRPEPSPSAAEPDCR